MMQKYVRQLSQLSIINFFFILCLLFFIQKNTPSITSQKKPASTKTAVLPTAPPLSPQEISTPAQSQTSQASPTNPPKNLFAELSSHNSQSNCWIGVGGRLYDVTTYFGSHPGGDSVITKYCGTDATGPFQSKDGIGANHSASAYDLLSQYLIQ